MIVKYPFPRPSVWEDPKATIPSKGSLKSNPDSDIDLLNQKIEIEILPLIKFRSRDDGSKHISIKYDWESLSRTCRIDTATIKRIVMEKYYTKQSNKELNNEPQSLEASLHSIQEMKSIKNGQINNTASRGDNLEEGTIKTNVHTGDTGGTTTNVNISSNATHSLISRLQSLKFDTGVRDTSTSASGSGSGSGSGSASGLTGGMGMTLGGMGLGIDSRLDSKSQIGLEGNFLKSNNVYTGIAGASDTSHGNQKFDTDFNNSAESPQSQLQLKQNQILKNNKHSNHPLSQESNRGNIDQSASEYQSQYDGIDHGVSFSSDGDSSDDSQNSNDVINMNSASVYLQRSKFAPKLKGRRNHGGQGSSYRNDNDDSSFEDNPYNHHNYDEADNSDEDNEDDDEDEDDDDDDDFGLVGVKRGNNKDDDDLEDNGGESFSNSLLEREMLDRL